jgi:ABC-type dipeptide/oligopeptide/nickel transport system permease component
MYRYLIRRLLWAGVLFLAVTIVSYIIFFLVPAEPARLIAGPQAPPDQVERVRKQMGFDDPVVVQYGRFLKRIVRLDLGTSYSRFRTRDERSVNDMLKEAAPVTISLFFGAILLASLIGQTFAGLHQFNANALAHQDGTGPEIAKPSPGPASSTPRTSTVPTAAGGSS